MMRIKQRGFEVYDPDEVALMTEDPPPQPPGRKLEDIPLFMREEMPLNFPDNRHLPLPEDAVEEIFEGTAVEVATRFKEKGNDFYRSRQWWHAREAYIEGIEFWPEDDKLMEALWLNVAAANLELKYWPGVLGGAAQAITLNLKSSKAYFRAARALIHYERYDEAVDCCKRVLAYDPTNEAVLSLLEDPKLGGNVARQHKVTIARKALEQAYEKNHLVILLNNTAKHHPDNLPYLNPAISKDPTKATLLCNMTFKYPERNAMDIFLGVQLEAVIGKLLKMCLPGRAAAPSSWLDDVYFDPSNKSPRHGELVKRQAEQMKLQRDKHPLWDPAFQYEPTAVSIYVETYKRQVIKVALGSNLGQVFQQASHSLPGEPDGICLEEGSIFFNVFRAGSKPEKLWLEGKGRKGFALAYPKYKNTDERAMLTSGQLRTWMIYSSPDHLEEFSVAARAEMLKGSNVKYDRA